MPSMNKPWPPGVQKRRLAALHSGKSLFFYGAAVSSPRFGSSSCATQLIPIIFDPSAGSSLSDGYCGSSPSASKLGGGGGGRGGEEGGLCECERDQSNSISAARASYDQQRQPEGGVAQEAARQSAWLSSRPSTTAAGTGAAGAAATQGAAGAAIGLTTLAEPACKNRRPVRQRDSPRSRTLPSSPSLWLEAGRFLLREGVASALDLRGGARAMSAPAADGEGGGGGRRDEKARAKAGGAGGKEGSDGRTRGGESRGKSVPLAGRPLFTSVASTKVRGEGEGGVMSWGFV